MNRRNFILGLGTAATLSGAASVTGAALQGSVDTGADFRVVSAQQLDVRRNPAIETADGSSVDNTTNAGYINASDPEADQEGNITFVDGNEVYDTQEPLLTVDDGENGALNMSLAAPNSNSTAANRNTSFGGTPYFANVSEQNGDELTTGNGEPLLQVENRGSASADVAIEYTYGSQGDGSPISNSTINTLYSFHRQSDGAQISPDGDTGDNPPNSVTVGSGNTELISFYINYSDEIETKLRNELTAGFGGADSDLDLLDIVEVGLN